MNAHVACTALNERSGQNRVSVASPSQTDSAGPFRGRVRLHLPVRLTVRWWHVGERRYAGELEEMMGFIAYGVSLRRVLQEIKSNVLEAGAERPHAD